VTGSGSRVSNGAPPPGWAVPAGTGCGWGDRRPAISHRARRARTAPSGFRFSVAAVCFSLLSAPLWAQPAVRVNLGSDVTVPEDEARIPISLESGGLEVVGVEAEIEFPKGLTYVGEEAGPNVSAHVSAKLRPEPSADVPSRKVVLNIAAADGQVLPSALLAVVRFKVPAEKDDASGEGEFKLTRSASVTMRDGSKAGAAGSGGTITLLKTAPAIACFFYMH
jgi:hypothetical protein